MRAPVSLALAVVAAGCGRYGFEGDDDGDDDAPAPARLILTVEDEGGTGMVLGPDGLVCTDACEVELVAGARILLRGLPQTGSWLAGWDSEACGGNFDCVLDVPDVLGGDIAVHAVFRPQPNRAFITSGTGDGAIGGIEAGDAICQGLAEEAGLDGTFLAYLASSAVSAPDRLSSSRGWVRLDGAPIADGPLQLAEGPLQFAPWFDETGEPHPHEGIFLGTIGADASDSCVDWTANTGDVNGIVTSTDFGTNTMYGWSTGCDGTAHLLCVETGRDVEVRAFRDTGKLAFVTTTSWTSGTGRESADALCQAEAGAAGRDGTFLAAVATTTESIASRFVPGTIWTRADGVRLVRDGSFMTTDFLDVAPELTILGGVVMNDYWTGTLRFDQPAQESENCADWTRTTDEFSGAMHWTSKVDVSQPQKFDACDAAVPVLCLEK